jgi:TIR domain-containing protein
VVKKIKKRKPYQIFVSHATADKWLAVTLCEKLEEAGASTFRDDRDIDGGDVIPERIRSEIKRSRELVVLLTPHSVSRPWVLLEVGAAWGWRKGFRITPILYHVDVAPIPDMLKDRKAVQLNDLRNLLAEVQKQVKSYHGSH